MNGKCVQVIVGIVIFVSMAAKGNAESVDHDRSWYATAVQNIISYYGDESGARVKDLFGDPASPGTESSAADSEGTLGFNDEPTTVAQLEEQLKGSDSICLYGVDFGKQNGLAADLAEILILIGKAGIDERFVNLNMEYIPRYKSKDCDIIEIAPDGSLSFSGKPVDLADLPALLSADSKVGIHSSPYPPHPPFSIILAVVNTVGTRNIHHFFIANRDQNIEISADIYRLNTNGVRDVLSAPRLTTSPGYPAMIRVVENASGMKSGDPDQDTFHQEDLGNLGIRFSVTPQILGDYIRVSGVAILTKSASLQEMFRKNGVPVYSYSVNKTVVPFSVVLNEDNDDAEFQIADVDGRITRCRLSAVVVDHKGMSRADREMARSAGRE